MTVYIKEPRKTIITGPTGCGKTHLVLDMIEKKYNKHFDYIIIVCPTLRWNEIYHSKDWIKNDDKVWLAEPKGKLYKWIEKLSRLLACSETLFMIDDTIADEGLDKRRQPLLELAISGRHRDHYLWLLTPSYSASLLTHFTLPSYPKKPRTSDVIDIVGGVTSSDRSARD